MRATLSRRRFLEISSAAAWAAGAVPLSVGAAAPAPARGPFRGALCFFSKPVPQLSWQELAQSARRAGFMGIELTVRGGGHVLPNRAPEDLPKAVAALRAEGLEVFMITTALLQAADPTAEPILRTAGQLSIPLMKPGYYHWKGVDARQELAEAGEQFRSLVALAQKYGVQVAYHNHDQFIGWQLWDLAPTMDTLDPKWAGYYFDLENALIAGASEEWKVGANLAMPRLKMVGIKDFIWENSEAHGWVQSGRPLGQGACPYQEYLKMLAAAGYHGPLSLHVEYALPGVMDDQGVALSRDQCEATMAAAKHDLDILKAMLRAAYEGA